MKDATVITESIADRIVALGEKLPTAFQQSRVLYPPRYKKHAEHTGRFMQTKPPTTHTQTITPGLVSLRR